MPIPSRACAATSAFFAACREHFRSPGGRILPGRTGGPALPAENIQVARVSSSLLFWRKPQRPIVRFAESIGFEKVLADDIVRSGDVKYDWDTARMCFSPAFTNTCSSIMPAKNSSSSSILDYKPHAFRCPGRRVPRPDPLPAANAIQGTAVKHHVCPGCVFRKALRYIFRALCRSGSLIAVSDHAWPLRMHKDNVYNELGAYEENFLIPLLFVPPASKRGFSRLAQRWIIVSARWTSSPRSSN